MTESVEREIVLRTRGLTKHYGGIHALEDADFVLHQGEHVAIVGDNGAGKSTFVRQITGVEQPTSGEMFFGNSDKPTRFGSPVDARLAGIETVHQDLALAEDLDVPANVFLGREQFALRLGPFSILADKKMEAESREALHRTGVNLQDLSVPIRNMSGGQRQCVAISRAVGFATRLIIMDEPTAALGVRETAQVENIIRKLKADGIPLILVSHNLRQVLDLVDTIWVFRHGRLIGNLDAKKVTGNEVVAMITGVHDAADPGRASNPEHV